MPYVVSLVAMKLTVMMLLVSNKRGHPERMEALAADSSMVVTSVAIDALGEEELKNRLYWQMLENLEDANIEVSATNRTHPSSIWCVHIYYTSQFSNLNNLTQMSLNYHT